MSWFNHQAVFFRTPLAPPRLDPIRPVRQFVRRDPRQKTPPQPSEHHATLGVEQHGASNFHKFAVYNYRDFLGYVSRKVELSNETGPWVKKTTDLKHYAGPMPGRRWLRGVKVQQWHKTTSGSAIDFAFVEAYAYDWQGRRIGKFHCASEDPSDTAADSEFDCSACGKLGGITYNYDGGRVLVERKIAPNTGGAGEENHPDQIYSIYAHPGAPGLGLLQRTAGEADHAVCNDCTYYYLNDATGNCIGVAKRGASYDSGLEPPQFTRMDAWGNLLVDRLNSPASQPVATQHLNCASQPSTCQDGHWPDTKQVITGPPQYHGSEGYEADVIDPNRGQSDPPMGRSTGFIHVGARYYEPATGRFLQYDMLPIDPLPFARGQANRWTYAANDPVTYADLLGLQTSVGEMASVGAIIAYLAAIIIMAYATGEAVGLACQFCMARGPESSNYILDQARIRAKQLGMTVCALLEIMMADAKATGNKPEQMAIKFAQKLAGCRPTGCRD